MKKILKISLLFLTIVFVVIQFIPTKINVSTKEYETDFMKMYDVPDAISAKLKTSCYDCHSNNTEYPWYNRIQPITWFLEGHIEEGKAELNFNEFGTYSKRRQKSKLTAIGRAVENDKMPLSSYLSMHGDAKISKAEKRELLTFFMALKDSL